MSGATPLSRWPSVSLLMPNRDNAIVLDLVLEKLAAHTRYPDVELIVVDDGSTDGSREILRRWRTSKRFVGDFHLVDHEHTDGGVVDALNAGLAVARGELVVQLDADASIETPRWLERMVSFFSSHARIGAVTARIVTDSGGLDACGVELIGPYGFSGRGWEIEEPPGHRTSHGKLKRLLEHEWPPCEQFAEVDAGMGACMMYRRDAVLEIGGYDRGFAPVGYDDLDLTISLRRAGCKVFYLPDVRVVHHLGKRSRPDDRQPHLGKVRIVVRRARHAVGAALPASVRMRLVRALGWDRGPRQYRKWRATHDKYWRDKWGWDLLNPDIDAIRERWGETEICWNLNPDMRRTGELIIAAFVSASSGNEARSGNK